MLVLSPTALNSSSEARAVAALRLTKGIAVTNVHVIQGSRRREVDVLLVTPSGVAVIEVKWTGSIGRLDASRDWPWTVGEDAAPFNGIAGNPGTQANTAAKMLAAVIREADHDFGYVTATVIVDGDGVVVGESGIQDNGVARVMTVSSLTAGNVITSTAKRLSSTDVHALLQLLDVPKPFWPEEVELVGEGFLEPQGAQQNHPWLSHDLDSWGDAIPEVDPWASEPGATDTPQPTWPNQAWGPEPWASPVHRDYDQPPDGPVAAGCSAALLPIIIAIALSWTAADVEDPAWRSILNWLAVSSLLSIFVIWPLAATIRRRQQKRERL